MRGIRPRWAVLSLGVGASLLALTLELTGALHGLEKGALDFAMRLRPVPELRGGHPVAVVAIDAASIEAFGRWPWSRSRLAELVEAIREAGAAVIAVDLVLSERTRLPPGGAVRLCEIPDPDPELCRLPEEDCDLAEEIARSGNVVLGYFFREQEAVHREPFFPLQLQGFRLRIDAGERADFELVPRWPGVEANLTCFDDSAAGNGFVSHPRQGGVFRTYRLVARYGDGYFPPLALAAVAEYRREPLVLSPYQGSVPGVHLGEERIPADEAGALRIDYLGPTGTLPTVSALDLLDSDSPVPTALEGALVFLGVTETGVGDLHPSPLEELMPGVEIHATVAYNLLAGRYIRDAALQKVLSWAAMLALAPLVALLVSGIERYLTGSLAAMGAVALWPAAAFLAFVALRWHLLFAAPVLAGVLALVATLTHQIYWVDRQTRAFEGYVSPNVRRALRRDPESARRSRLETLTVLFTDIRGFSTRTEDMPSEEVVALLNDFFTPMTRVVLEQDGTLDKYMGDALMAFFGAPVAQPDHAARACRAALAMRRELQRIRRARDDMEGLDIGIGLNTGEMTVGDMGSQGLFDYTVIGRNVNLGQRLEAATKPEAFGVGVLVADTTREAAGEGFLFRKIGRLQAKGFQQPVTIHELVAERPQPGPEPAGWRRQVELVRRFERAYALYYPGRDFAAAEAAFRELVERYPEDRPSRYYLERCRLYRQDPPPPGWEGIEEQTKK